MERNIQNRVLSVLVALVMLIGVGFVPSFAQAATGKDATPSVSGGLTYPGNTPSYTGGMTYPSSGSSGSLNYPSNNYSSSKPKPKPYTTNSCYSCGWGSSYPSSFSYDRDSYFALTLDFSDNDIDQSVTNNITNNVIGNTNSNIGINNSQETNQNAAITNGRTEQSRSGYYSYFDNFYNGRSTSGNSNSSNSGQNNNANQSNIFNSSSKSGSHNDDDDDDNDDLRCEIDASDTSVDEGDRVTLEWDTEGADDARINQGIGSVDEDGGTERVRVDETTTFRLTVENDDGDEETCSVTVRVDDENDFSSIVIADEPIQQNPYSAVYLSDIPYTGLDLGPYAWAYWAAIAGLLAAGSYVVFFMGIPFVLRRTSASIEEAEEEIAREDGMLKSAMTLPATVTTTTGTAVIASQSDVQDFVEALVHADDETASEILEEATKDGVSASVFLNRASALLRSGIEATKGLEASVIENLVLSLEAAAKARA
ncbi:MAG: hypothetical protein KBD05_00400 [Candidatus Pacebacteria bacterium]|nr:hypothetical protein [Candidatus Paceibacterota bacterium]